MCSAEPDRLVEALEPIGVTARSPGTQKATGVGARMQGEAASGDRPGAERRRRFAGPAILLLLLPLVAVPAVTGVWAIRSAEAAVRDQVTAGQVATARALAAQVAQSFDAALLVGRTRVTAPGFLRFMGERDVPNVRAVLENIHITLPVFRSLAALDSSGRLLVDSPTGSASLDRVAPSQVTTTLAPRLVGDDAVVAVQEPVVGADGATLGWLVAEISLDRAMPHLRTVRFGQTGTATLLDADGRVLLSGASERRGRTLDTPELLALARDLTEGQARYHGELVGAAEIGSFAPVPKQRWGVLVTIGEPEAFAVVAELTRALLLGVVAAIALGLAIALLGLRLLLHYERELRLSLAMQRAASEQLAAANSELTRVNAALQEETRRVEEASRHKSQFLANMSHELRTPLNAVLGFAALLQEQLESGLTERQRRHLRNIQEAGEHLLELINDVLDLSRVEAGRLDLRPETVAAAELLEPVLGGTRAAAASAGVGFAAHVVSDVALRLDPARFRQILFNLLSNAVKFTPRGGRVALRLEAEDGELVVTVTDTGIGIPPEQRHRVFGMFERLHEERSEVGGAGLGLALTKRLVELHGGSIGFESEEGRGTTFVVRVPGAVARRGTGDRILIVEDERHSAELIAALVDKVGLEAEVAWTAAEALAAVRREAPLAIVLDLILPDRRGEEVLETIKADPATRSIPVVVVSIEDDSGRSRPLGADDHLTKPIDHARLEGWLREVVSRSSSSRARRSSA